MTLLYHQVGKIKSKTYIMTSHFFPHIIAIDMYQISQGNFFFKKTDISPICGFFQNFLALFDTFTTRYSNSGIKFKFSDQFQYIKHFISKKFLKMN